MFDVIVFDVFSEVGFELGAVVGDDLAYWEGHQSETKGEEMAGVVAIGVWHGECDGVAGALIDGGEEVAFEVV